jgi:hypothetical protein
VSQVTTKTKISHSGKNLIQVIDGLFRTRSVTIEIGQIPRFWEDMRQKHVLVADILSVVSLNIMSIRLLTKSNWIAWLHLVLRLMVMNSSNEENVIL